MPPKAKAEKRKMAEVRAWAGRVSLGMYWPVMRPRGDGWLKPGARRAVPTPARGAEKGTGVQRRDSALQPPLSGSHVSLGVSPFRAGVERYLGPFSP